MLLFLVLAGNSALFWFLRSYTLFSSRPPFLCALARCVQSFSWCLYSCCCSEPSQVCPHTIKPLPPTVLPLLLLTRVNKYQALFASQFQWSHSRVGESLGMRLDLFMNLWLQPPNIYITSVYYKSLSCNIMCALLLWGQLLWAEDILYQLTQECHQSLQELRCKSNQHRLVHSKWHVDNMPVSFISLKN